MKRAKIIPMRPAKRGESDQWQAGLVHLPTWVEEDDGDLFRPWAVLATSLSTGVVGVSGHLGRSKEEALEHAESALDMLADLTGKSPRLLEVAEDTVADALAAWAGEHEVPVERREQLESMTRAATALAEGMSSDGPIPAALSVPGVNVDDLRAFAEAMAALAESAPWRWLDDEDMVKVEAPRPADPVARWVSVIGAAGEEHGLLLFDSPDSFRKMVRRRSPGEDAELWSVSLWREHEVPFPDLDLWEAEGLPKPLGLYPVAAKIGPGRRVRRASPRMLAFLEGLLRSLAEATEEQFDSGRWISEVGTRQGPMRFTLAIPSILELASGDQPAGRSPGPPSRLEMERVLRDSERMLSDAEFETLDEARELLNRELVGRPAEHRPPRNPQEEAEDLGLSALQHSGRRSVVLARKALALWPDCSDAHVALARAARTLEESLELLRQAVAAGERALGPRFFEEEVGHFWGSTRTRPYMRARHDLAEVLDELGHTEEAVAHYRELLRLNPNDNQGIRMQATPALIALGDIDGAVALLEQNQERGFAWWEYNRALAAFAAQGATSGTSRRLRSAFQANPHVPPYLLGEAEYDETPAYYQHGSEEEAVLYHDLALRSWFGVPGALEWLERRWEAYLDGA